MKQETASGRPQAMENSYLTAQEVADQLRTTRQALYNQRLHDWHRVLWVVESAGVCCGDPTSSPNGVRSSSRRPPARPQPHGGEPPTNRPPVVGGGRIFRSTAWWRCNRKVPRPPAGNRDDHRHRRIGLGNHGSHRRCPSAPQPRPGTWSAPATSSTQSVEFSEEPDLTLRPQPRRYDPPVPCFLSGLKTLDL